MDLIDRMRAALESARGIGAPLKEYRLHPDDYEALRKQCEPLLQYDAAPGSADSFAGVKIIQDDDAERLPRCKTPNAGSVAGEAACR